MFVLLLVCLFSDFGPHPESELDHFSIASIHLCITGKKF